MYWFDVIKALQFLQSIHYFRLFDRLTVATRARLRAIVRTIALLRRGLRLYLFRK